MPKLPNFHDIFTLLKEWFDTPTPSYDDFNEWRFRLYDECTSGSRPRLPLKTWWPHYTDGDYRFELCIGALLVHQVSWRQVERSILAIRDHLKEHGLRFDARGISSIPATTLEELIRTTGFYRQKARRILGFCRFIEDAYGTIADFFDEGRGAQGEDPGREGEVLGKRVSDTNRWAGWKEVVDLQGGDRGRVAKDSERVREKQGVAPGERLMGLKMGFGKETRDSVLLYAANVPVFIADSYARKLLQFLGVTESKEYDICQITYQQGISRDFSDEVMNSISEEYTAEELAYALPNAPPGFLIPGILLYQQFHAGIDELGISRRWEEFRKELFG